MKAAEKWIKVKHPEIFKALDKDERTTLVFMLEDHHQQLSEEEAEQRHLDAINWFNQSIKGLKNQPPYIVVKGVIEAAGRAVRIAVGKDVV